jgi:outer membrane protein assembly factor BamB
MTHHDRLTTARLTRRTAMLLLPLAATGCSLFDDWFGDKKTPLEGTRQGILVAKRGLEIDNPIGRPVTLPAPVAFPDSPQAGGTPAHVLGNVASSDKLATAWTASIGAGGGYRNKITARPVVAGGHLFTMDTDAVVTAFDSKSGAQLWRTATANPDDDNTNVGGGIAFDAGRLFVATGLGDALVIDPANGKIGWRVKLPTAARAAPTIAEGRLYIPTLDNQLVALSVADGSKLWAYQAPSTDTSVLGLPSPAYADGLLVAGFSGGDLICLRAGSGAVTWTDSLAAVRGRTSLVDLSAIHGMPAILDGRVYATGLGGLMVCLDLRSGRRLWERELGSDQTPWVVGDWLFVVTVDQALVAVNRQDGAIAWITQLPQWLTPKKKEDPIRWLGPVVAQGRVFLVSSADGDCDIMDVDPGTGTILGHQPLPHAAAMAPVPADGTLYVVTDDGTLLALR